METKNLNTKYCVGLGEILFDVLPSGSQLGGAPANFAYHAGQHGLHSVAVSAIGKDALGDTALRILDEKKLKYVMPVVDYPTGTVQVQLDKEGVPTYDIKQGVAWDNIPFTSDIREIAVNAGAVCWGSLAQRSEVSRKTIYTFLDHTPEDCLKIFDINLRQNFYTSEVITESLKRCNVLKINDEELITIGRLFGYPGLDIENKCWLILGMPSFLRSAGARLIVMSAIGNLKPLYWRAAEIRLRLSLTASSPKPVRWYMTPLLRLTSTVTVVTSSPLTAAQYVFTNI